MLRGDPPNIPGHSDVTHRVCRNPMMTRSEGFRGKKSRSGEPQAFRSPWNGAKIREGGGDEY